METIFPANHLTGAFSTNQTLGWY